MDEITRLFHKLHPTVKGFYPIQGFRAGYNNAHVSLALTQADSELPAETRKLYAAMYQSGKEANSTKVI